MELLELNCNAWKMSVQKYPNLFDELVEIVDASDLADPLNL